MRPLQRTGLAAGITLGLVLPFAAGDDAAGPVAEDVPVRVEKDLFHAPVRLAAADGVIDSGAAWGHSGPWVEDVDGDGVKDLVVGDFSGLFRFYRNAGTNQQQGPDRRAAACVPGGAPAAGAGHQAAPRRQGGTAAALPGPDERRPAMGVEHAREQRQVAEDAPGAQR